MNEWNGFEVDNYFESKKEISELEPWIEIFWKGKDTKRRLA
ncbi:MAG: hypothetical protein WBP64_06155 [Nitrososphaeraceae archaeon]